jgi:hypothetical protein
MIVDRYTRMYMTGRRRTEEQWEEGADYPSF